MNEEDYNELMEEYNYEAYGGKDSGFCMCGAVLTEDDIDVHDGICEECR